jgi:hypothetical protein
MSIEDDKTASTKDSNNDSMGDSIRVLQKIWNYFLSTLFTNHLKHRRALGLPICAKLRCTVLSALQKGLRRIEPKATRREKLRCIAKSAENIVQTGASLGREMGFRSSDISRALSRSLGSEILDVAICRKRKAAGDLGPCAHSYRRR